MKTRHMHLNLFLIDFPITAIASIIHRVTGVLLFIFIPFVLYFFYLSVESSSSFIIAKSLFSIFYIKICFYSFLFSLIYHCVAGIKHMIMDLGFFEEKDSSRTFAIISLLLVFGLIILSIFL